MKSLNGEFKIKVWHEKKTCYAEVYHEGKPVLLAASTNRHDMFEIIVKAFMKLFDIKKPKL